MQLNLTKPIVFFDLETTGVDVGKDRIVEISLLKVMPDGTEEMRTERINPGMPIPPESTAVHGITDADVKDKPTFEQMANEIINFIGDADLAGYNSNKFDIPLLVEEFLRVGVDFDLKGRRFVDVQNIFHKMEQRTLSAAYKFYCGKSLDNAHAACFDTMATYEVLKAQLDKYQGVAYTDKNGKETTPIVNDITALSRFSTASNSVDLVGHIVFNERGEEVFNFGKYKGKTVESVFKIEPQYYDWMMRADFPRYTKKVITQIRLRSKTSSLF